MIGDILTVDQKRPARDILKPADHPQQGGFATARRAHEDDKLAFFDLQVDAFDHLRDAEPFFDGFEFDTAHQFLPAQWSHTAAVHVNELPPAGPPVIGS